MTIEALVCYADGRQILERREVPDPEAAGTTGDDPAGQE